MSITISNYSNKSTCIEDLSEINTHKDNLSVSGLSEQWERLSIETPDTLHINRNNKRRKPPETSIIIKQPIQEPVNPRKRSKENNLTDVEKK